MLHISPQTTTISRSGLGIIRNPTGQSFHFWRFLLGGIAAVLISTCWLMNMEDAEKPDKFGVSQYYNGREPKSSWVSVNGRLYWDGAAYEGTDLVGTWYVPMVSRNWDPGDKVQVLVKVGSHTAEDWGEIEEVQGMLTSSVPGFVKRFFATEGPHLIEDAVLLREGADPGTERRVAHILIVLGLVAIGGSLLLYDPDPLGSTPRSRGRQLTLGPRASDLAEARGEIAADDPQILAREDAVQQWMREHGLKETETEPADEPESVEHLV